MKCVHHNQPELQLTSLYSLLCLAKTQFTDINHIYKGQTANIWHFAERLTWLSLTETGWGAQMPCWSCWSRAAGWGACPGTSHWSNGPRGSTQNTLEKSYIFHLAWRCLRMPQELGAGKGCCGDGAPGLVCLTCCFGTPTADKRDKVCKRLWD